MPLDPSIPLALNNISYSQPLIELGERRRREKTQLYEQGRRDKIDESNLASASQQRELGAQNIALNKSTIEQGQRNLDQGKKELEVRDMERIILEVGAMSNLVNQGNSEEAAKLGMGVREKLIASGQDVTRWDGVLMGIKDNPQAAAQYINQMAEGLKPALASLRAGAGQRMAAPEPLVIKQGDIVVDPQTMQTIASNKEAAAPAIQTPEVLLRGLEGDDIETANALYVAAGGGKAGIDQINTLREQGKEAATLAAAPATLRRSFPNASPAEMMQLEAAVSNAGSAADGMQMAGEVRAEQRRLEKAKVYQDRAVSLLRRIVDDPELNDVTGGIEGGLIGNIIGTFDQDNSDLIADIEEATSILTSDNMDLMTGVLSESDIQLLKDLSAGGINRKRGLAQFKADVSLIIDRLGSVPVQTINDQDQTPEINSQAEYDALPSGASFIQNGQPRKKP